MVNKAVYAGSFDPLTNGHLWMIEKGARLFDELVVAVGLNKDKVGKGEFSLEERTEMIAKSVRDLPNVTVGAYQEKYLIDYAKSVDADFILRGIRSSGDYEQERGFRQFNGDRDSRVTSTFLMPPRALTDVSSSFVKSLVGYSGWEEVVEGYIPRYVYNKFLEKFEGFKPRWQELWKSVGAKGDGIEEYDELRRAYCDSKSAYHNLVHISHSLRELDSVEAKIDKAKVEMAIWYHDAKGIEEEAATLAEARLLGANVHPSFTRDVSRLIMDTKHNLAPETLEGKSLADIDLSILGKSPEVFAQYDSDIGEEYSEVPEKDYILGRTKVLQSFLNRIIFEGDNLYHTQQFRDLYEAQARENLENAIELLKS